MRRTWPPRRKFYEEVIGLECFSAEEGRDAFFRCGDQVVILFNRRGDLAPEAAHAGPGAAARRIRPRPLVLQGRGLRARRLALADSKPWERHIEADFEWSPGLRSIYVRDPAGNSIEIADERLWDRK